MKDEIRNAKALKKSLKTPEVLKNIEKSEKKLAKLREKLKCLKEGKKE